mmetsp:Transcript_76961/g.124536  ORF Transcript_76961/g.124536 Transcript_76961/m.124536 type:complete len:204 (+) Transcript_76961:599-1210(+)
MYIFDKQALHVFHVRQIKSNRQTVLLEGNLHHNCPLNGQVHFLQVLLELLRELCGGPFLSVHSDDAVEDLDLPALCAFGVPAFESARGHGHHYEAVVMSGRGRVKTPIQSSSTEVYRCHKSGVIAGYGLGWCDWFAHNWGLRLWTWSRLRLWNFRWLFEKRLEWCDGARYHFRLRQLPRGTATEDRHFASPSAGGKWLLLWKR